MTEATLKAWEHTAHRPPEPLSIGPTGPRAPYGSPPGGQVGTKKGDRISICPITPEGHLLCLERPRAEGGGDRVTMLDLPGGPSSSAPHDMAEEAESMLAALGYGCVCCAPAGRLFVTDQGQCIEAHIFIAHDVTPLTGPGRAPKAAGGAQMQADAEADSRTPRVLRLTHTEAIAHARQGAFAKAEHLLALLLAGYRR